MLAWLLILLPLAPVLPLVLFCEVFDWRFPAPSLHLGSRVRFQFVVGLVSLLRVGMDVDLADARPRLVSSLISSIVLFEVAGPTPGFACSCCGLRLRAGAVVNLTAIRPRLVSLALLLCVFV